MVDYAVAVALGIGPALVMRIVKVLLTAFREHQLLIRERILEQLEVFIFRQPTSQGLILNGLDSNGQSLSFKGLSELHEVLRTHAVKPRKHVTAAQHVLIRLHESRRTPRASLAHQVLADHLRHVPGQRAILALRIDTI